MAACFEINLTIQSGVAVAQNRDSAAALQSADKSAHSKCGANVDRKNVDRKNVDLNHTEDFELEITNTGEKPIYYLQLMLFFDVPNEYRDDLVTAIVCRNPGFNNMRSIATADDVPIKPGESKRFTLHRGEWLGWDNLRHEQHLRLPTKVKIQFQALSFGDGTGFVGEPGAPYPPVQQEEVSR